MGRLHPGGAPRRNVGAGTCGKRPSALLHWIEHVMRNPDGKIKWHHTRQYGGATGPQRVNKEWEEIAQAVNEHNNA